MHQETRTRKTVNTSENNFAPVSENARRKATENRGMTKEKFIEEIKLRAYQIAQMPPDAQREALADCTAAFEKIEKPALKDLGLQVIECFNEVCAKRQTF